LFTVFFLNKKLSEEEKNIKESFKKMEKKENLETATFATGWFWTPDAFFAVKKGVIATRVGYTGGTSKNPSYYNMADHTESIQIDFDPKVTSYSELLKYFWKSHSTSHPSWSKQYMSAIFYSNEQEKEALASKQEVEKKQEKCFTQLLPLKSWTNAEDYHQKYYLRGKKKIVQLLNFKTEEELRESHISCRLNGYVDGEGDFQEFEAELKEWNLPEETKKELHEQVKKCRA